MQSNTLSMWASALLTPRRGKGRWPCRCFLDASSGWHARLASFLAALGCFLVLGSDHAAAYTTATDMQPTNLTIRLVLNTAPLHDNFTRYLTFTNRAGNTKAVALDFVKTSNLHYQ